MQNRIALLGVLALGCARTPPAAIAPTPISAPPAVVDTQRVALQTMIDTMAANPRFGNAMWGVLIVDPAHHDTLYALNAHKLFLPASNMKIVTGVMALKTLGPDFQFKTTFAARGRIRHGVLYGDLIVTGRGDPTVSDRMMHDAKLVMRGIADSLFAHGIHRIMGRVESGDDVFLDSPLGAGWEWEDLTQPYAAGVDALMFNEGTPTISVDSVSHVMAYHDPAAAYLTALDDGLAAQHIRVDQNPTTGARDTLDTIFTYTSAPLRDILPALEKPSQNQIAEILLKTMGLERNGVGSADSGIRVEERQLAAWNVDSNEAVIRDGSGLSRHDYLTPSALVTVLDTIADDSTFSIFYNALPVAGVDGTMGDRLRDTPAANNAHAKTGYVDRVRTLSGYVTTLDGTRLTFSLLCNNWTVSVHDVEAVQDAIVARLAELRLVR